MYIVYRFFKNYYRLTTVVRFQRWWLSPWSKQPMLSYQRSIYRATWRVWLSDSIFTNQMFMFFSLHRSSWIFSFMVFSVVFCWFRCTICWVPRLQRTVGKEWSAALASWLRMGWSQPFFKVESTWLEGRCPVLSDFKYSLSFLDLFMNSVIVHANISYYHILHSNHLQWLCRQLLQTAEHWMAFPVFL